MRGSWYGPLLGLALALALPRIARAEPVTTLEGFLDRLDAQRAVVTDFTATFRQAQYASLFDETKLSLGTLKYRAPGDMLWEYAEPDRSFLRVGRTDVQFYFPLLEQIEVYPIGDQRAMRSLLASFNQPAAELRKDYRIEFHPAGTARADFGGEAVTVGDAPGIGLVPIPEDLQAQFTRIDVWVRPDSFVPCLLRIEEAAGDRTTFLFERIQTNVGLDDAALDFQAPPGTTIVRSEPGA